MVVRSIAEKRRLERFSLELPAQLYVGGEAQDRQTIDLLTSDICAGGAFFETEWPLPVGSEVKIDLVLPLNELKKLEGRKALIKVSGAVIRSDEKGMAICFDKGFKMLSLQES